VKTSIRKFLLINLLLAITITTSLTAIGNYYLDQNDIQEHLDTLMAISALSYQSLLVGDIYQNHRSEIQKNLDNIPKKIESYYKKFEMKKNQSSQFADKFNFQVWTYDGKILLHTNDVSKTPLTTNTNGFSDQFINNNKWRVFTISNDKTKIRTVLAERYGSRNELGHLIAQDDFYIMLLTFPLSGLLIWIIISRGLDSLDKVAEEVSNRAPTYLEPVNIAIIPEEIKPLIDELNKLFFRLKEGFEREKRFTADAAHELRTPLAGIKTQAQIALNTKDLDEKNNAIYKLLASVNRATHIIQQLLTMSRLVSDAEGMNELIDINLPKITREVLANLATSAIEKNIELELQADEFIPTFTGNPTSISIIVQNLVDNAIRYSNENSEVIVKIYHKENDIILEVHDNGPGIPKELRTRVFERFFRILGNKSPGSGLGLAISKQIANMHHGQVKLESNPKGTGLIAIVNFPIILNNK